MESGNLALICKRRSYGYANVEQLTSMEIRGQRYKVPFLVQYLDSIIVRVLVKRNA